MIRNIIYLVLYVLQFGLTSYLIYLICKDYIQNGIKEKI